MSQDFGPVEYLHYMGITCWQERTAVFSRGNPSVSLMLIGEAPGFYEDQQGKPFEGEAGKLLDAMLASIDLKEDDIYIANVLKCRPPNNRDPAPEEMQACRDYLEQQIHSIAPRIIVALGQFAGQFLLGKSDTLSAQRLIKHSYQKIPFFVTYHPAYLLRNPGDKKRAYQDLLLIKKTLNE